MAEKITVSPSEQAAAAMDAVDLATSQISALVDGELAKTERALLLRRLSRDYEAQGRWERYHLISDAMRDHLPAQIDRAFAARLHDLIALEPLPSAPLDQRPTWYKAAGGFAIAASVVLATMYGLQSTQTAPTAATAALPSSATTTVATWNNGPSSNTAIAASDLAAAQLDNYLVNHNGYASRNSVNGMLPYVRMVGYQTAP